LNRWRKSAACCQSSGVEVSGLIPSSIIARFWASAVLLNIPTWPAYLGSSICSRVVISSSTNFVL
jgi:hypothetical protein